MQIVAATSVLPPHRYAQAELTEAFTELSPGFARRRERIEALHRAVRVETRHLALPKEAYREVTSFDARNAAFIEVGLGLGERAVREALEAADVRPDEVDALLCVSVTGVAVPTLDARLVHRLGLRPDVKRVPIFGLGCVAGAAGVARLSDYVRAFPEQVAVLLSVELCSLTVQVDDPSPANLIACGLFGDGAAAVVGAGEARAEPDARPRVRGTRSVLYPDTEHVMGWDVGASGFRVVLSADVPAVVREHVGPDVDAFLADHGLGRDDVAAWVCHPGGPKVLLALQEALDLDAADLARTWRSLAEVGNLSSASVLFVLRETLDDPPPPGSWGVLLAMGPGFCAELVLLEW